MQLYRRYKESLKAIESEEVLDLVIYRPLAFLFVTATYRLPLTPNEVSVMAMIVGVLGGVLFGAGSSGAALALGAGCYFLSNVLDCADGQIARLKKNGTRIGRIVDGFIDYIVSIAVFLGIGVSLSRAIATGAMPMAGAAALGIHTTAADGGVGAGVLYVWILTILAGVSTALQAFHFDLYRNNYLKYVYGKSATLEDEIRDFEEEKASALKKRGAGRYIELLLIGIYLGYCRLQLASQAGGREGGKPAAQVISPEVYARYNKTLLRAWSYIGSTTHITVCVVAALAGNLEAFLLITVLPLNLLMGVMMFLQSRADRAVTGTIDVGVEVLYPPPNTHADLTRPSRR